MGILGTLAQRRRSVDVVAALICAALLGYAYYLQYQQGLDPCPLCIFQRVAVAGLGLALLLAALMPQSSRPLRIMAVALIVIVALAGAGVAARHLYIQSQPPGAVAACGATLDYLLDVFSVTEVLRKVLTGSGECAKITWTRLGISMPGWVLAWIVFLGWLGAWVNWPRRARRS
jgi:protein dithiol:quinone oxidoreductase